jgi:N-acetylglutamate synthase-like GNAT family acetyltransferase
LRQPWDKPRGSECDSLDDSAFHLLLLDSARKPLACGRLHFNAPDEAQVRFMAVDENARGRGYGSRILEGLKAAAARRGAQKVVLNAP